MGAQKTDGMCVNMSEVTVQQFFVSSVTSLTLLKELTLIPSCIDVFHFSHHITTMSLHLIGI